MQIASQAHTSPKYPSSAWQTGLIQGMIMSNECKTIPWHDDEKYTVNGIKMVYLLNKIDKENNYVATYNGLFLESNLRLMGYEVVRPKRQRILEPNGREMASR